MLTSLITHLALSFTAKRHCSTVSSMRRLTEYAIDSVNDLEPIAHWANVSIIKDGFQQSQSRSKNDTKDPYRTISFKTFSTKRNKAPFAPLLTALKPVSKKSATVISVAYVMVACTLADMIRLITAATWKKIVCACAYSTPRR